MKINFKFFYVIILALSFGVGYLSGDTSSEKIIFSNSNYRNIANEERNLTYGNLPCPSESEFLTLMKRINFKEPEKLEGELCDSNSIKGKLGKLIKYISTLNIQLPKNWKGGAKDALSNPLDYISKMNSQISINPSSPWVAYNIDRGKVYLAPFFFNFPPLTALTILIHESRHSSSMARNHVKCRTGKKAHLEIACDQWFRTDQFAGAYAYELSFSLGMAIYADELSQADRNYLISTGIMTMINSFVHVRTDLGLPFDTVIVLGEDNNLYYIHPILKKSIILLDGSKWKEIAKIKFNRSSNGLFLIMKNGQLIESKNSFYNNKNLYDRIQTGIFAQDIEILTIRVDTEKSKRSSYFLIDDHQNIWIKRLIDSGWRLLMSNKINITQLIHSDQNTGYVLTKDGELKYLRSQFTTDLVLSNFQDPRSQGWLHVYGGIFYENIFGVNKDGELFYRYINKIWRSNFQVANSIVYLESTNFKMQMNREGVIFIKRYGEDDILKYDISKEGIGVRDVAYSRSFLPNEEVYDVIPEIPEYIRKACDLSVKKGLDPWTNMAMGINSQHKLVFQTSEKNCESLDLEKDVKDYKFSGSAILQLFENYSQIYLEVTFRDGGKRKIYPYSL